MVDIQSVAAEIRRGKKRRRRKKLQGKNIMAPLLHRAAIMNDICDGMNFTHLAYMLIATLPCKSRNTENA